MKTREQKYQEAVERNIRNSLGKAKYRNMPLQDCKQMLGVRRNDTSYDELIKQRQRAA